MRLRQQAGLQLVSTMVASISACSVSKSCALQQFSIKFGAAVTHARFLPGTCLWWQFDCSQTSMNERGMHLKGTRIISMQARRIAVKHGCQRAHPTMAACHLLRFVDITGRVSGVTCAGQQLPSWRKPHAILPPPPPNTGILCMH